MDRNQRRSASAHRLTALLLIALLLSTLAPAVTAADNPYQKTSAIGVGFPVYKNDTAVTFRWTGVPKAATYAYVVRDLAAKRDVKRVTVKSPKGALPASMTAQNASYKVTISARDAKGKAIESIVGYFHVGKAMVRPSGAYSPKAFTSTGTRVTASTPKPQTTTPLPSAKPSPTPTPAPSKSPVPLPSDAPAYMQNNSHFAASNGNADDHWANAGLNDTFWNDVYKMTDWHKDELGFIAVDPIMERDVFKAVNQYRSDRGLTELVWNDTLCRMARARSMGHILQSASIERRRSHDIKELGGQFEDSVKRWGLRPVTAATRENIAWFADEVNRRPNFYANEVLQVWIDSLDHEQNMRRDAKYGAIGVVWSGNMYMGGYVGMDVVLLTVE